MGIIELVKDLRYLISNSILGEVNKSELQKQSNIQFGFGPEMLTFVGAEYDYFQKSVSTFWNYRRDLFNTVSEKTVEQHMVTLIRKLKISKGVIDNHVILTFFEELESLPLEDWEIFKRLHGTNPIIGSPIQLGPFHIYQYSQHSDQIYLRYKKQFVKYPDAETQWSFFWDRFEKDDAILISIHIQSREAARAIDMAAIKFRQFESTIRFMIGKHMGQFDVGIYDYRQFEILEVVGLSPNHVSSSSQISGAFQTFPLNDPHFVRVDLGYNVIWELLKSDNHPDLYKRILIAVEWAGKGARDPDQAKAFVQFMFGIESLLTYQEKGVLITASIASQISELAAFILGTDFESRKKHYSTMSRFYSSSSAIAHGGSNSVSLRDVQECFDILRIMINVLLSSPKFKGINTIKGLKEWVEVQKFSTDSQIR